MPIYVDCPNCTCRIKLIDINGNSIEPLMQEEAKEMIPNRRVGIA